MLVYDSDNRTLLKKSWASAPGPDGKPIGAVWVLARFTPGADEVWEQGVRVPARRAGYSPYIETACAAPSEDLNARYIRDIDRQLTASAELDKRSFEKYMSDEFSTREANERRDKAAWRETAAGQYDNHVGAYGNCAPGTAGGYMSFGGI